MKSLGILALKSLLGGRLALGAGRLYKRLTGRRGRALGRTYGGARRGRRNNRRTRGARIEIDRNVGGRKQPSTTGPKRGLTVDIFKGIVVRPEEQTQQEQENGNYTLGDYRFYDSTGAEIENELDIVREVNLKQEFKDWRTYSSSFKVTWISISFEYSRTPVGGEDFSKLLLQPETDIVNFTAQPNLENNSMVWSMTNQGTKQYIFRPARANTYTQDLGWQTSSNGWASTFKVEISNYNRKPKIVHQNGDVLNGPIYLGDVHIAVRIVFKLLDRPNQAVRFGDDLPIPTKMIREIMPRLAKEHLPKYKEEILQQKKEIIEKQQEYLDQYNISDLFE